MRSYKKTIELSYVLLLTLLVVLVSLVVIYKINSMSSKINEFSTEVIGLKRDVGELAVSFGSLAISYSEYNAPSFGHFESKNEFFIDPMYGHANNDGSFDYPWQSLTEVISSGYIESEELNPNGDLEQTYVAKNQGAPIKPGDIIYLMSGDYGVLKIKNFYNKKPITITSYPGHFPSFDSIEIDDWSSWNLINLNQNSK